MKYDVFDVKTGKVLSSVQSCWYVVTTEGKVAWWDEGQGWLEDDHQELYEVRVLDVSHEAIDVDIERMVEDVPEYGRIVKRLHERITALERNQNESSSRGPL